MRTTLHTLFLIALAALLSPVAFGQVRVSTADAMKAAVKRPAPEYGSMARQLRVTGDVDVEVTIGASGEVEDVKAVSGNAILTANVLKTVKDWKFTPFTNDGKATAAIATLRFSFKP